MTLDDLDRRYAEASWLVHKSTARAGLKALTIGWERLDHLTSKIADVYDLSPEDRRRLKPTKIIDANELVGSAANKGRVGAGAATAFNGIAIAKAVKSAANHGRLIRTAKMFVTAGPKAARLMANTGRVAGGKSNPIGWILTGGFAIGTLGWFGYQGRRFNLSCYNLLADRRALATKADD